MSHPIGLVAQCHHSVLPHRQNRHDLRGQKRRDPQDVIPLVAGKDACRTVPPVSLNKCCTIPWNLSLQWMDINPLDRAQIHL